MPESLRIFGILLYKSWLVRKRHWIVSLIVEILIPVALISLLWSGSSPDGNNQPPEEVKIDHYYEKQSLDQLLVPLKDVLTYYAPSNPFTDELMKSVNKCFKNRLRPVTGFTTENDFNVFYRNIKKLYGYPQIVIFDKSTDETVKHLNYKLRYVDTHKDISMSLYNNETSVKNVTKLHHFYILRNHLTQMQICLDRSFINIKSKNKPIPDMYIQRVPYPAHIKAIPFPEEFRSKFRDFLLTAYLFPLFIETWIATKEKFTGVNVFMTMNGISNTSNQLSWTISGLLFLSISFVILIFMLLIVPRGIRLPFMHYGNPLLLYFILIFYLTHLMTFGIHVSAYFPRAWLGIMALYLLQILGGALMEYGFSVNTLYLSPYIGVIFPDLLFCQALDEIHSYESRAEGIQWYNLFMNAKPATKIGGSVGMVLILFVIGIIFHFSLALYVYAIKPRKYGAAKHPLYFLKYKSKRKVDDTTENLKYDATSDQHFEATPEGVYTPGIQIRNLKKVYNINLFTKQKVYALRDVSVDFYKGHITSLLGHNGAGKTTMMSILTGMMSFTQGKVLINSKDLKVNASEIMKDIGLCTQEDIYFSNLTVSEQLLFFAMVKGKDKPRSSAREDVKDLLQKLQLYEKKDALPSTLSGGQKRRLCLGMAIIGDPNTLILDEPTSGLDPESRRVVWEILLKMRGQKTILISTHDMEEADILGDIIAIMHAGELKSYGTSLFLKKLIGQNNVEITLSIEPRSDPEKIRSELQKDAIVINREVSKMVVKIPNSPALPDTLDNLEKKKKELGVTGFSVSLISLEQVFLNITQENDNPQNSYQTSDGETITLTGRALYMQTVRALLRKKLIYAVKDFSTIFVKIFFIFMALSLQAMAFKQTYAYLNRKGELIPMNLMTYHKPDILYTSYDKRIGEQYKSFCQDLGGNPIEVTDGNLENDLLRRAEDNIVMYDNYMIAAAEFNDNSVKAFYSEIATFSLPISINLLWNTILKNLMGPDYSISLSLKELPLKIFAYENVSRQFGYGAGFLFVWIFCLMFSMYIVHPNRENFRGVKQLQKMTGISSLTYWGTIFLFDLIEYALLVMLVIIGSICIDFSVGLRIYRPNEILVEILLLVLFGINTLLLMYIFSLFKKKTNSIVVWAILIPLVIVPLDLIISILTSAHGNSGAMKSLRSIQKGISLLLPYVGFAHSQVSFFKTAETNARCYRLPNDYYDTLCNLDESNDICCDLDCYDGKCKKSSSFFADGDADVNMKSSVIYLCLTPVLYCGILALIESELIFKCKSKKSNNDQMESNSDELVQQEKAMIFERIQALTGNEPSSINNGTNSTEQSQLAENGSDNQMFLIYELRKNYGSVEAVKDISFGVNRRECFGLLGVNGAGKSTTFRMMTGGEIPNHGIMYIGDKNFENDKKYFLSQIGYCPQHDAIIECLNSYHHLQLFARLRGIPENEVKNEVQAWIDRLNLNSCARQPSGTYSGGNRRRLNIAIALIGDPNLILMDEPTSGIDPGARRSLWNVIKSCQMAGQSVVLTSHSMAECEALCDRLAIMVNGKFVCIGASEQLKQRFGAGYDIKIKMNPEKSKTQVDSIKNDVAQSLNCILTDENLGYLMYHVAPAGTTWRKMYDVMNGMKKKYDCIDEFFVLSSSLEQLFLLFARSVNSSFSSQAVN